jgi:fatty-acyl-CoA synthase
VIHLGDWTAYWARRTPDAVALVEPSSERRWTYRELDRAANQLAHGLAGACGVGRGDRVALLAHNSLEHFALLFACGKLGAMLAPLNWRLAPRELDEVLADADPKVLFYDDACATTAAALGPGAAQKAALCRASAGGLDARARLWAPSSDAPAGDPAVGLEDPLLLCYTSGTTGRPKGALLSHRQLLFNSLSTELAVGLSSADSTLVFMPMFHTGGLNCLATPILHHGGKVVVMPAFDAERALTLSADERVTMQMAVPTIFELLRDAPSFRAADLSSVRMALCGGAPCPLPLIETYRERGILFRQGYGLTEVGPNCFSLTEEDAFRKAGSVGWPNFYVSARIINDADASCADGEPGELVLGGPMVTLGYFRNPAATEEAFRGTAWFHTGDQVTRDAEGYHYIVGRKKDMFISGGENVYPVEIEQALATVAGVAEVCVIGVADARWGEVGRAVVVAKPGARLDEARLLSALDGRLARYKIPKSVVFAEALPRNASGKILRAQVREGHGAVASNSRSDRK